MGVPSFFKYLLDQYKKNDFIIQKEIQDKKTQDKNVEYNGEQYSWSRQA